MEIETGELLDLIKKFGDDLSRYGVKGDVLVFSNEICDILRFPKDGSCFIPSDGPGFQLMRESMITMK